MRNLHKERIQYTGGEGGDFIRYSLKYTKKGSSKKIIEIIIISIILTTATTILIPVVTLGFPHRM